MFGLWSVCLLDWLAVYFDGWLVLRLSAWAVGWWSGCQLDGEAVSLVGWLVVYPSARTVGWWSACLFEWLTSPEAVFLDVWQVVGLWA